MRYAIFTCVAAFLLVAQAQADDYKAYGHAYEKAVKEDVPLLIAVKTATLHGADLHVESLPGYSAGVVVWCYPKDGQLWHAATIENPTPEKIAAAKPKRIMVGCENGKCTPAWAPAECQVSACPGGVGCNANGICAYGPCASCKTSSQGVSAGACSTGQCGAQGTTVRRGFRLFSGGGCASGSCGTASASSGTCAICR